MRSVNSKSRHPRARRDPVPKVVIPAHAGIQCRQPRDAGFPPARERRNPCRHVVPAHAGIRCRQPRDEVGLLESGTILTSARAASLAFSDVVPAQSGAARGGAISRRSAPRAGRRGQRQDPCHHRKDRASDRTRLRSEADRRDHVHQPCRSRDARARRATPRQGRNSAAWPTTSRSRHFMRWDCASSAATPAVLGLEARFLDPRSRRHRVDRRRVDRDDRSRACAGGAVADQRVEERARIAPPGGQGRSERRRGRGGASVPALQRHAASVSGRRLRRPDRAADRSACDRPIGGGQMARALRAPPGRRVSGHEPGAVSAVQAPRRRSWRVHRRRRRRPGDLRLARRIARQPRRAAEGLPRVSRS